MPLLALTIAVLLAMLLAGFVVLLLSQNKALRAAQEEARQRCNELAHAGRLAAVGQLSASIAHEINQPLGAILSNADAAELLLSLDEVPLDDLRQILADIRADDLRAHEVIRRLRSLLEKREIELHEIDLRGALQDVGRLLAAEAQRRRVDLTVQHGTAALMVRGDAVQLEQIVLNLALNAMDAVADGPAASRWVSIVARQIGTVVEVSVLDKGPGIAPEVGERVFESFYTTKPHGLGLGLSIARSIALSIGTRAEGGAAITLRLPRLETAAAPVARKTARTVEDAHAS